jgi:hypothetical protein
LRFAYYRLRATALAFARGAIVCGFGLAFRLQPLILKF